MNDLRGIEDRLRDATHAYADELEFAPGAWDRIARRTRAGGARRRALRIGGTSAVAAAAIVAGALLLADDDPTRRVETPPGQSGPTASTPATSAPAATGASAGVTYVRRDGTLVTPARTSTIDLAPRHVVRQMGYDADGSLVTLTVEDAAACGVMSEYGLENVTWFSFSPEGDRLAYVVSDRCAVSGEAPQSDDLMAFTYVVVRDLASGAERVWTHEPGLDDDFPLDVDRLTWSPDGTRLAIDRCGTSDASSTSCDVAVLDVSVDGGRILDAQRIVLGHGAAWIADNRIAFHPNSGELAFVDPSTGAVTEVATAEQGYKSVWAAGDGLLVLTFDGALSMIGGDEPGPIAVDVTAATWVDEPAG